LTAHIVSVTLGAKHIIHSLAFEEIIRTIVITPRGGRAAGNEVESDFPLRHHRDPFCAGISDAARPPVDLHAAAHAIRIHARPSAPLAFIALGHSGVVHNILIVHTAHRLGCHVRAVTRARVTRHPAPAAVAVVVT
jgi:hypothetical protein